MRYKVASALCILAIIVVGIIICTHNDIKYDIENVDVELNVSTYKDYLNADSKDVAKFYWYGKEIDKTKKKGFYVGYSYDNSCNILKVHLMQKGHKERVIGFVLD